MKKRRRRTCRGVALDADVPAPVVLQGFPPDQEPGSALVDGDDGGAADQVVAGCHGQLVGTGNRNGKQVAGADVAGQVHVGGEDVAGLAVAADDRGRTGFGSRGSADQTGA